jgi:hypothetical protein
VSLGEINFQNRNYFCEKILQITGSVIKCNKSPIKTIQWEGAFIMDEQKKRVRRTPEQIAEDIEAKIQKLTQEIETIEEKRASANQEFDQKVESVKAKVAALEQRKQEILAPKPAKKPRKTKKQKIAEILKQAQKSGMKPEQIAEALGVNIED